MISNKYTISKRSKVPYYRFSSLSEQTRLIHGIFSRHGGVSKSPYDTLNVGFNVGDHPENVGKNLEIIQEVMGAKDLIFMNQVHGQNILILKHEELPDIQCGVKADAMITNIPHIGLMVKQADCQAVILFDPQKNVLANAHCGWRGNAVNILDAVVQKMKLDFGCRESDLIAAISPSLGPCCAEFMTHKEIFPQDFRPFMLRESYFNLWEMSRMQLLNAGLPKENIEIAGICSKCHTDIFYSYRAEGTTGRSATVAMLIPEY
jgi:YfiH family protein